MIFVICGPTGVGKSALALQLALKFGGEIINGDAYQVYRQMDIGTAKPSLEERQLVPHHLYDIVDVTHAYNVAEHQLNLRAILAQNQNSHKPLFIVGGNGLYVKAALYDYEFKVAPAIDLSRYDAVDDQQLHEQLQQIDPVSAAKIHPHNRRRVLRALAIYHETGVAKSALEEAQQHQLLYPAHFIGLNCPREQLYQKIDARVEKMLSAGLVEEVLTLHKKYPQVTHAFQAIGYKEIIAGIKLAQPLATTIELIKQHSRNYAKRQLIFYRTQLPVIWFESAEAALQAVQTIIAPEVDT